MDTTSSALCRFFWLLAKHPDAQDRLRKEIRDAKERFGQLNYDQVVALPYLDAVCRETLRLWVILDLIRSSVTYECFLRYPPIPLVTRTYVGLLTPNQCWLTTNFVSTLNNARVPLLQPIRGADGKEIGELLIPKGTKILVSIQGCNRSHQLWGPDALEWKPERWMDELPKALIEAKVPGVYSHL
jgi:cytochrome P450